jgi:hypothetical protein
MFSTKAAEKVIHVWKCIGKLYPIVLLGYSNTASYQL